jgi:hypothetical protein
MIHCLPRSDESQVYIKKCTGDGILRGNLDPVMFLPFRANAAMDEINRRPDVRQLQWAYSVLKKIGTLARAMGYLVRGTVLLYGQSLMNHPARGQSAYVLSHSHRRSTGRRRCL